MIGKTINLRILCCANRIITRNEISMQKVETWLLMYCVYCERLGIVCLKWNPQQVCELDTRVYKECIDELTG